ncbi:hydroxyisourate hydrolase [Streptomyces sp. NBC_00376]|uniref:hydroxyisourate hydrolase n=1 Tax=Streptomyces sp. NBC_00376 TaxID=2975730 RepID=UPI003FCDEC98
MCTTRRCLPLAPARASAQRRRSRQLFLLPRLLTRPRRWRNGRNVDARSGYELLFHVDEYYDGLKGKLSGPPFIDQVPVRYTVFDATQHFPVPVICTPWNCTTYRGS